jgi:hypothetical protein
MIGRVLSFARGLRDGANISEAVTDPGGGDNTTADYAPGVGVDAPPLAGDYIALLPMPRAGGYVAVGGVDTVNAGEAAPGEFRAYGRDASGAVVAVVWLKGDGSIHLTNAGGGSIILEASGVINLNGATVSLAGIIEAPNVIAGVGPATVSLLTHVHTSAAPGSPTSPPTPGT